MRNAPLSVRFWRLVARGASDACWEWRGYRGPSGYGRLYLKPGAYTTAHRASWIVTHGEIPDGKCVLHHCDNRACVNPDHLFIGTQQDNMADMNAKGRRKTPVMVGETHPAAKLTEREVLEIRASALPREQLEAKYGVSKPTIHQIINRQTWKHV